MSGATEPQGTAAPEGLAVSAPVSPGELIDRITILEIKAEHLADAAERALAADELGPLVEARDAAIPAAEGLDALTDRLKSANESLWAVKADLRAFEAQGEFGSAFIALARAVHGLEDERAALRREIDALLREATRPSKD